jgi:hypothetical protein
MSSLNDHVKQYASGDSRKNARESLLDAITAQVAEVLKEDSGTAYTVGQLKDLATAYALVIHGPAAKE